MTVIARHAEISDAIRIATLGERLHGTSEYAGLPYELVTAAAYAIRLIEGDDGFVMVAEDSDSGDIVGYVVGYLATYTFNNEKYATDVSIYADSSRRAGAAVVKMIREFITWAREQGALEVSLAHATGIHPERTSALYEKLGLRRIGAVHLMRL